MGAHDIAGRLLGAPSDYRWFRDRDLPFQVRCKKNRWATDNFQCVTNQGSATVVHKASGQIVYQLTDPVIWSVKLSSSCSAAASCASFLGLGFTSGAAEVEMLLVRLS